jgi:hypothetical protein
VSASFTRSAAARAISTARAWLLMCPAARPTDQGSSPSRGSGAGAAAAAAAAAPTATDQRTSKATAEHMARQHGVRVMSATIVELCSAHWHSGGRATAASRLIAPSIQSRLSAHPSVCVRSPRRRPCGRQSWLRG